MSTVPKRPVVAALCAALLCGCHSPEIGPPPPSIEPREFRIIVHTDASMTDAIVEDQGGDPTVMSDGEKKKVVMPYLTSLLEQVNAIYKRNLGVSFFFHPREIDWIDTGVSPFGACGHSAGAYWNSGLVTAMDDPPDLATMLEHCDDDPSNSRGYSHWRGLCTSHFAESVMATGRRTDSPEVVRMVAHELGHLMGASHTFGISHLYTNGDRHFEPGCGSTIMAYGGGMVDEDTCAPSEDFVDITDDYFHGYSVGEMQSKITDEIERGACGRPAGDGIHLPAPSLHVRAPDEVQIPARTPFCLRADVAPTPGDVGVSSFDVSFDEIDDDGSESLLGEDHGTNTILRSRLFRDLPVESAAVTRCVPSVADVAAGASPETESPPSITRALAFRVMARAQHAHGASTAAVDVRRAVVDTGRAFGFRVGAYPPEGFAGHGFTVTWDPASTAADAAFDAARVRLRLCITTSCDDPQAFTVPLVDAQQRALLPNTGSAEVFVPPSLGDVPHARIIIENEGGTFFDVGRTALQIHGPRLTDDEAAGSLFATGAKK